MTSEYPLEPWIAEDLATQGKARFTAVSGWTRVDERPAGADSTMIWHGGQFAFAHNGFRLATGALPVAAVSS